MKATIRIDNKSSNKPWLVYLIFIVISEVIGLVSGLLSMGGMKEFESVPKPLLTPPPIVFPIVWTILFALMGISQARVWLTGPSENRLNSTIIYAAQLVVNFFWSIFFFNNQAYGFSFIWLLLLWALVLWEIIMYYKSDKAATFLQIPYLLWLTFAAYLNYMVWILNM